MYKESHFRSCLDDLAHWMEAPKVKSSATHRCSKCAALDEQQATSLFEAVVSKWRESDRKAVISSLEKLCHAACSHEVPFVQCFKECGSLMVQEIFSAPECRMPLLTVFAILTNNRDYSDVLVESSLIEVILPYLDCDDPKIQEIVLAIYANLCRFPHLHQRIFASVDRNLLLLIARKHGVTRNVVSEVFRLFLNISQNISDQNLFDSMIDTSVSLMEICPPFCQPVFLAMLAILSDIPDFGAKISMTRLPDYVSEILTSTDPSLLRFSLHILCNIYQQITPDEFHDLPRVIRIIATSNNEAILSKACGIVVVILRSSPGKINETIGKTICDALFERLNTDTAFTNTYWCLYSLAWVLSTFPNLIQNVICESFIEKVIDQLYTDDTVMIWCCVIILHIALLQGMLDRDAINAKDVVLLLEKLTCSENVAISETSRCLIEYLK